MEPIYVTGFIAVFFYMLATALAFWQLRHENHLLKAIFLTCAWLAVLCHAWSLWHLMVKPEGVALGIFPIASAITLSGTLLILASSLYRSLEWVSLMVLPASILLLPPALLLHTGYSQPLAPGIATHVVLSILAYAVMTIATCQSVLIMNQHRQLKEGNLHGLLRLLPPMQTMETMQFELLWTGVLLLTAAIATGLVYVDDLLAQHLAHQTILTLVAWLIFALLLTGRHVFGWRSITAGRLTIAGFVMLLVAFFGTRLIIDLIHHQGPL